MKLGLVKILTKRFGVCEEAYVPLPWSHALSHKGLNSRNANATIQCPVERGSYTVEQTVALPKEIPKGKSLQNDRR